MQVKLLLLSKDYLKGYNAAFYNGRWYNVTIICNGGLYHITINQNGCTILNKVFNDLRRFNACLDRLNIQVL